MPDRLDLPQGTLDLQIHKSQSLAPPQGWAISQRNQPVSSQGTLDLLILKALSLGPQHGWAISERIHQVSREVVQIPQGSLYPALHRLERRGWIAAEWGASDNNRRAKYYELTRAGRRQLETERRAWEQLTTAVDLVLRMS